MLDEITLAKTGRYVSGLLIAIFLINLLLDSQLVPGVDSGPFFGSVAQFVLLLVVSALVAVEFMIADRENDSHDSQEMETDDHSETPLDAPIDS